MFKVKFLLISKNLIQIIFQHKQNLFEIKKKALKFAVVDYTQRLENFLKRDKAIGYMEMFFKITFSTKNSKNFSRK